MLAFCAKSAIISCGKNAAFSADGRPRTAAKREYTMQAFEILLPLALILCLSKLMGLGAHRIGMPAVIGMLLAGILIGSSNTSPGSPSKTSCLRTRWCSSSP